MHGAVVVLLSTLVSTAAGFPNGAPLEACTHMTPQHPALQGSDIVSPLTSYNPYTLTLGSTHYSDKEQEIEGKWTIIILLTRKEVIFKYLGPVGSSKIFFVQIHQTFLRSHFALGNLSSTLHHHLSIIHIRSLL